MFKALRIVAIAATAATLTAGAAHASINPHPDFGTSAPEAATERHIAISAGTKWVNVNNGDTVTFDVGGQSFTWHFDTLHAEDAFDLAKIAPAGVDTGMVTVYVASNPLYRG